MEVQHPEVKEFSHWSQTQEDVAFMCSLLNELSTFNNGDSLHYSVFSISKLLKNVAISFAISLDEQNSNIEFSSDIVPDLHNFTGDKIKLEQVLLNLLKNAQEAITSNIPHGLIHLKATRSTNALVITLEDNGCGIPADHLDSIFEPFTTYKQNGTGLGLSLFQTNHRSTRRINFCKICTRKRNSVYTKTSFMTNMITNAFININKFSQIFLFSLTKSASSKKPLIRPPM